MKPPEEVLRGLVEQWISKAELDYEAGSRLVNQAGPLREIVAFHCQQAVEKYLKAFLVRHQVEFPKTHNLEQLLDLISQVAPDLAASLESAAILTPYGIDIRYPGDFPNVLPGQEMDFFELAGQVREAVMAKLSLFLSEA